MLLYLFDQPLDFRELGAICGNGVCFCAGLLVGKCVEGCDGFVAGAGFAAGDEDFGAAGLEEALFGLSVECFWEGF